MLKTQPPLSPRDWDFRRVPDKELIACCLWEYSRESRSLAFAAKRKELKPREVPDEIAKAERAAGFSYDRFLNRFFETDLGFVQFYFTLTMYGGVGAKPWQAFPMRTRRYLVGALADTSTLTPLRTARVWDLEQLWKANNRDLLEIRARGLPPDDDSEDGAWAEPTTALVLPTEPVDGPPRNTTVAFTIDYSRFSDLEITAAFTAWLGRNRPKRWRQPRNRLPVVRRGIKLNDYRVALERLAMMRLLHWYSPKDLERDAPNAWKMYGRKESNFRREIRAAVAFYHGIFPFISQRERPVSAERFNTWLRAIVFDGADAK